MATRNSAVPFVILITVSLWSATSRSPERYAWLEEPRLTSVFVCYVVSLACWLGSLYASWFPWLDTSDAHQDTGNLKLSPLANTILPPRPRRQAPDILAVSLAIRLELFLKVANSQQCSTPGVESLLPILLLLCSVVIGDDSTIQTRPRSHFFRWMHAGFLWPILGTAALSIGAYLNITTSIHSSYFCPTMLHSRQSIALIQYSGVLLDSAIAMLLWQILGWARTAHARLRIVAVAFSRAGLFSGTVWIVPYISGHSTGGTVHWLDAILDGVILSALIISSASIMCKYTPVLPSVILVLAPDLLTSASRVLESQAWLRGGPLSILTPLYLTCGGIGTLLFAHRPRLRALYRPLPVAIVFVFLASALLTGTAITLLHNMASRQFDTHPLKNLIHDTRIETDRWLRRASVSTTLRLAVEEYRIRSGGRLPPPKFDEWFKYSNARNSAIVDQFDQVYRDTAPFWALSPSEIRRRTRAVAAEPGVSLVRVKGGAVTIDTTTHNISDKADSDLNFVSETALSKLVEMITSFAEHLPDMDIPVNLYEQARVLPSWRHAQKRVSWQVSENAPTFLVYGTSSPAREITSPWQFQHMFTQACPPSSPTGRRRHLNAKKAYASSVSRYSSGLHLTNWDRSLDICAQPDLLHLHGAFTNPSAQAPFPHLVPLFSVSKVDGFHDILIPLLPPGHDTPDSNRDFQTRTKTLYWRGNAPSDGMRNRFALPGNHKHRFVNLVRNATSEDTSPAILTAPESDDKYVYQFAPTADLDSALPFDVAFDEFSHTPLSSLTRSFFPFLPASEEPLKNQHILLLDSENGPSPDTLRTIQSGSLPYLSSIYRTWYTERIRPWIHFVPLDIRLHALHSTVAYFVGLKGRGDIGGREIDMSGASSDALWIANQGRKWANRALREEDMAIYLFRVLLEWGRLLDEGREGSGFVMQGP